jgi:hypothetical protein
MVEARLFACDGLENGEEIHGSSARFYALQTAIICLAGEACERYAHDLTPTVGEDGTSSERPCVHCGLLAAPDGPDACLGLLPGVVSACCGHGAEEPYVLFHVGHGPSRELRGAAATQYFSHLGVGLTPSEPPSWETGRPSGPHLREEQKDQGRCRYIN